VVEKTADQDQIYRVVLTKTFSVGRRHESTAAERLEGSGNQNVYSHFTVSISDLHKKLNFRKVFMDSTGLGAPIYEHCLELGLPAQGINLTKEKKEELFSNLKVMFVAQRIRELSLV
jgi:hypothetical protein